ncbi:uncharacterized protein [Palaemon carinicauda]|uniref:uncharacterized protein isoform X2 n=1 Tax=Palaemon carinicauda TaxID=392227 RepID=UPI0035B61AA7
MADSRSPRGGGEGGKGSILKRLTSSDKLKRSSSVEILTGLTAPRPRIVATSGSTSAQQLDCKGKGPSPVAPVHPQKNPITKSVDSIRQLSPISDAVPSSVSSPSINRPLSIHPSIESLSSVTTNSSGYNECPNGLSPPMARAESVKISPSRKTTVLEAPKIHKPTAPIHSYPNFTQDENDSPVPLRRSSIIPKPVVGEGGHIFKVTTKPPDTLRPALPSVAAAQKSKAAEPNPLSRRRGRKEPMTLTPPPKSDSEEPVWQRRLSLLFVPPNESDLQNESEPEECSKLLPPSFSPVSKRKPKEDAIRLTDLKKGEPAEAPRERHANKSSDRKKTEETPNRGRGREEGERGAGGGVSKSNNRINFSEEVFRPKHRSRRERQDSEDELQLSDIEQIEEGRDSDDLSTRSSSNGDDDEDEEEEGFRDGYTSWDDTICSNRSAYFKLYYSQRGVIGGNRGEDTKSRASRASSHNSLSELIREKMGRPQLPVNKKTRADLGLMILVGVLFIVIVVGISLTSYFYNLHLLEMTIFSSIKFFEKSRVLQIYNPSWEPVATAHLGSNLPVESIPEDCTHYLHYLHRHNQSILHKTDDYTNYEDFVCLEWTSLARLQLRKMYRKGDVQCYSVWWVAAKEDFTLRDCLQVEDEQYGSWWGGGEMSNGGYPLTNANVPPSQMVTGKLGSHSWGQLLRRTWLSDRASLLTLPDHFQGYVSVNHESDKQLCLESRSHPLLKSAMPTLEYSLCTAPNMSILSQFLYDKAVRNRRIVLEFSQGRANQSVIDEEQKELNKTIHKDTKNTSKSLSEVFGEETVNRVKERIDQPVWVPWMPPDKPILTQEAILKYVESIINHDYGNWGHILLPPSWQALPGDLTFDKDKFPDPAALVNTLEKKGFRLALSIHPFVSVHVPAFANGTQAGLWVRQSKSQLPALAKFDEVHSTVVTDFSNPKAKEWFSSRLKDLQDKYKIDRFHLQPADAHALPAFHEYHLPLPGPDSVLVHFMASVSSISPPMSSEAAVTPPLPPTFLTLGHADGSWRGLETLIPRVLTLTTLGYPLIDIGVIGGLAEAGHVPERELYIRWIEVATFLPALQVNVLPRMYGEEMKALTLEYNRIRKEVVLPRLHENIPGAIHNGTSLITPLALFAPSDPVAAKVDSEWILGKDLLVAPVTNRGERTRDIYLPEGIWEDGIDKHLRRGGRWIYNYKVPLTKVPFFIKKPMKDEQ